MQPAARVFVRTAGFVAAPLVGALLILSIVGSYSPDLSILLFFLFALLGIIAAVVLLVGLILALRRRQWHRIVFVLAGLTLAAVLAFPAWLAGDYIHFAISYARNADTFAKAGNRSVAIPWNSNGFAGINCDRYLIYDPSGRGGAALGQGVVERHLTSRFHIRTFCT
jgi:lysylphosphatidylglycerol synthetase-like protein (DUF2156 family)